LIHCAIPFVGNNYCDSYPKILLYASAENLTGYNGYLDDDAKALNRYRSFYEHSKKAKKDFFPDVHIAPISDGSLILVVLYLLKQLGINKNTSTPFDLIESISFSNFGKYSVSTPKNTDYANDINKLRESIDYIACDIETIKPDILILPNTIYKHKEIRDKLKLLNSEMKCIPIYQINASVINQTISKYYSRKVDLDNEVSNWYLKLHKNKITGKTKNNFLSVFTYLDKVFEENKIV